MKNILPAVRMKLHQLSNKSHCTIHEDLSKQIVDEDNDMLHTLKILRSTAL